ncbi:MAG: hypothetical protein ACRENQ_02465, partial [Gemmatimonadaceae bacterium]
MHSLPSSLRSVRRAVVLALVVAPFAGAHAQSTSAARSSHPRAAAAAPAAGKPLELGDFAKWNRITSPAVSSDG